MCRNIPFFPSDIQERERREKISMWGTTSLRSWWTDVPGRLSFLPDKCHYSCFTDEETEIQKVKWLAKLELNSAGMSPQLSLSVPLLPPSKCPFHPHPCSDPCSPLAGWGEWTHSLRRESLGRESWWGAGQGWLCPELPQRRHRQSPRRSPHWWGCGETGQGRGWGHSKKWHSKPWGV